MTEQERAPEAAPEAPDFTGALDNDFAAFINAQELLAGAGGVTVLEVSCPSLPLARWVDGARLQAALSERAELQPSEAELEYLGSRGLSDALLSFLRDAELPQPRVLLGGGSRLKVSVAGHPAAVALWDAPISATVHQAYFEGRANEENLEVSSVLGEALRRVQTKLDLLRHSGTRFVEAGARYRYRTDWYAFLLEILLGDVPDLLVGTTNAAAAAELGLEPRVRGNAVPFDPLGRRAPTVAEAEAALPPDGRPLLIEGANAWQMAHLHSHLGDRVEFWWGADLTADVIAGTHPTLEHRELAG